MREPRELNESPLWLECRRAVRWAAMVGVLVGLAAGAADAATYYISPGGNDSRTCVQATSSAAPRQSLSSGLGCLSAGDTLVLQDGTYSGSLANIPNGSAGFYVTIRAQNDGGAIVTGAVNMDTSDAYIQVEGLRFQSSNQKNILGHHIKFRKCEFKGGGPGGNVVNTVVGTSNTAATTDILIEDSWFHGPGGRYNLLVYNSERVVVRRVVIRHDGGWSDTQQTSDPEAGINIYNSDDTHVQNVIVVDSNLGTYDTWAGAFYNVRNPSSVGRSNNGNSWTGIIALNNKDLGFRGDGAGTSISMTDVVLWDNTNGGLAWCCSSDSIGSTVNRVTIGRSQVANSGDWQGGFGNFSGGSKSVTNAIVYDVSGPDFASVSPSYFNTFSNGSTTSGTGRQTYDPRQNGLSFLARIETGSPLKTQGSGGGQIGANIQTRIGATGTLKGEANWNADTGEPLWPWPNETRIKQEMCTDASVTRGFCGDSSLTNYIWNYLGNGAPVPPAAPTNLRIVSP